MPTRFEQYRIRNGDNIGDPETLNARFRDVDLRLASQEDIEKTWQSALEELQRVGLTRINEVLLPIYNEIQNLADLGAMFTSSSTTDLLISTGLKRFTVIEADRDRFAPAAYVAAFLDGDLSKAMLGQVVSYDRASGVLEVNVDRVNGTGSHAGWILHAASATDNAGAAIEAQQHEQDAQAARDTAIVMRDEAASANASSQSARDQAEIYRDGTQAMRDDALAAQSATQIAIGSMSQIYLGAHPTAPLVDLNGDPLVTGAEYFNSGNGQKMTYHNGGWIAAVVPVGSEVVQIFGRTGTVSAQDGDYDAAKITVLPVGNITADRVQTAIAQLDTIKADNTDAVTAGTGISGGGAIGGGVTLSLDLTYADARYALAAHEHSWANITAKPTTLASLGVGDIYSKSQVDGKFDALMGGATGIADTLGEIQALIGDNDTDIGALFTQIGTKLNSSSVSAFGLTLIDDTSAAAARSTLGMGSAATYASTAFALAGHDHNSAYLGINAQASDSASLGGVAASSYARTDVDNAFSTSQSFAGSAKLQGGVGARTTGGVLDWNDNSNARSGCGATLLTGSAFNGPGTTRYFHPFNFEYFTNDGTGNICQLAFPYNSADGPYFRYRYNNVWAGWNEFWHSGNHYSNDEIDALAGGAFEKSLLQIEDQKPAGTNAGTFIAGDWRTRDLNTIATDEITGASLASNQITLPAGTYMIEASAPSYRVNYNALRLYDVTNSVTLVTGDSNHNWVNAYSSQRASLSGRFTLVAPATMELQHRSNGTYPTQGFGLSVLFSVDHETYAIAKIWKVA